MTDLVISFKRLLIYRFAIVNSLLALLVLILAYAGYIIPIFANDISYVSYGIVGLFVTGWAWSFREIVHTSLLLDEAKSTHYPRAFTEDKDKADLKVEWLDTVSEWLVALGLIGTVIGFSIALSGVNQGSLMQAKGAQTAVSVLMDGMRVALNTTLLGASLAIWHQINMRMFRTASGSYWLEAIKRTN